MAEKLQDAVRKFADDLAKKVETFITDVTVLEVRTFSTPADQTKLLLNGNPNIPQIAMQGQVMLRAYTQISFDGDTTVCVPVDANGEVDKGLWDLHRVMVQEAMMHRATMIKTMGDAAASALTALRKANE